MHEYEGTRRLIYGEKGGEYEGATFIPVCPQCARFVKADAVVRFQAGTAAKEANATCSRCGRVTMPFEGFF